MTSNLKNLGLALIAAFAVSAVVASGASAAGEKFHCAKEQCILTATSETEKQHDIVKDNLGNELACHGSYQGNTTAKTVDEITLVPAYSECTGGHSVTNEHCAWIFKSSTDANGHAKTKLECAAGGKLIVHTSVGCTLTFEPQEVEQGVHYVNGMLPNTVTAEVTAKGLKFSKSGGFCFVFGTTATLTAKLSITCSENLADPLTGTEKTTPDTETTSLHKGEPVSCFHE